MGKVELAQRLLSLGEAVHFAAKDEGGPGTAGYLAWKATEHGTLWANATQMHEFEDILGEFCATYNEIDNSCSRSFIEKYLDDLVWQAAKPSGTVSSDDVGNLAKTILDHPVEPHRVIREVQGLVLDGDPLSMGPCRLLRLPDHLPLVQDGFPLAIPGNNLLGEADTIAMTDVQARDTQKAEELADEVLFHFDAVLRYMLLKVGGNGNFGIFTSKSPSSKEAQILTPGTSSISWGMVHPAQQVTIKGDDLGTQPELGPLLAAMLEPSPNDMQRRIRSAVRWTSTAIASADEATSMAQLMFGVEALFTSRGEPIAPSIMASISSSVAWLIGANAKSRLDAARHMKRIYGKRSAIVHGATFTIDHRDLTFLEMALRRTIRSILVWDTLSEVETQDDLGSAIRKWSFGNMDQPPGDF